MASDFSTEDIWIWGNFFLFYNISLLLLPSTYWVRWIKVE